MLNGEGLENHLAFVSRLEAAPTRGNDKLLSVGEAFSREATFKLTILLLGSNFFKT